MLWNNRHLERSFCGVERSITVNLHDAITVTIDISTTSITFHFMDYAQYDGYSKLEKSLGEFMKPYSKTPQVFY